MQSYPCREFITFQAVICSMVFPVIPGATEYVTAFAFELQFFFFRVRQDQAGAETGKRRTCFTTANRFQ